MTFLNASLHKQQNLMRYNLLNANFMSWYDWINDRILNVWFHKGFIQLLALIIKNRIFIWRIIYLVICFLTIIRAENKTNCDNHGQSIQLTAILKLIYHRSLFHVKRVSRTMSFSDVTSKGRQDLGIDESFSDALLRYDTGWTSNVWRHSHVWRWRDAAMTSFLRPRQKKTENVHIVPTVPIDGLIWYILWECTFDVARGLALWVLPGFWITC